ncbi:hypothetical protein KOW79_015997 [Hemibagrus wyckioides]|uniref:Uncharacterized protein n=1 Tax=Hemibagrus wyckioides TaxID=337641 RepID=A0A9D3NEP6_9TELE|nr:hypothetical protein KOW79_015997 [Hemibagrus wyckioides]
MKLHDDVYQVRGGGSRRVAAAWTSNPDSTSNSTLTVHHGDRRTACHFRQHAGSKTNQKVNVVIGDHRWG